MHHPLVSIIIPTFNRQSFLPRAIESVLKQDYNNWELIIIDDGSTDETKNVIENLYSDERIQYFYIENSGVAKARNVGIKMAKGEWLAFLDSDDEWCASKLKIQIELTQHKKDCLIIHGEEIWIRNGVQIPVIKKNKKFGGDLFEKSLELCLVGASTILIKKEVLNKHGMFNEEFLVCEDYDLWLRLSAIYPFDFVEQVVVKKYAGHDDQLSMKYKAMDYFRFLSIFNLLKSTPLNDRQKELAVLKLKEKAKILLKGYLKYNRMDKFKEIEELVSLYP